MASGLGRAGEWVGGRASYLALVTEDISEVFSSIYREWLANADVEMSKVDIPARNESDIVGIAIVIVKKLNYRLFFQTRRKLRFLTNTTLVDTALTD